MRSMESHDTSTDLGIRTDGMAGRVLLVDDLHANLKLLSSILAPEGYQLLTAGGGREALARVADSQPDLVVLDVMMPDVDGFEVCRAIKASRTTRLLPVVLVTAHHDADFLSNGSGHIMAYLSKPVKTVDLLAAINLAVLRFDQFRQLQAEAATLRQALEDRKLIERAKGIVMKRLRVDEEDAFRRLRRLASDGNAKLIEVAQQTVSADEVFQELERR